MRPWIIIFISIFVVMLAFPLILALIYYGKKAPILNIRQDYSKDVRYFGHSFARMMEKALPSLQDDTIRLSKVEKVLEIKADMTLENTEIDKLVIARKAPFYLQKEGMVFGKEIYSEKDAMFLAEGTKLRAIYSKERILLGNNTQVVRWVDAEKSVVTYDDCNLGRSTTSGEELIVGFGNRFHRLYAPKIRLGQRADAPDLYMKNRDSKIFRLPVISDVKFNRHYIADDMITESGTVPYTIISKGNVKVIENIILQGNVHSDKSVRIMENAVVLGNIFAEDEVLIERNATVLGNVFTQGDIILEEGAAVGQPDKIISMIARERITFYGDNYVFGFISSEAGGKVIQGDLNSSSSLDKAIFPEATVYDEVLTFKDLEEYLSVDSQGFRKDNHIKQAVIPEGAQVIPVSQFFSCPNLEEISIPRSVTVIDEYAFADCGSLELKEPISALPLEHIQSSAFENCKALELDLLPDSLETIGSAAFAGCSSITSLRFGEESRLRKIGDHAFRRCSKLQEVYLPDCVESVGVSAFRDCDALESISVPASIREQIGITEMKENCPAATIHYREVKQIEEK